MYPNFVHYTTRFNIIVGPGYTQYGTAHPESPACYRLDVCNDVSIASGVYIEYTYVLFEIK